MPRDTQTHTACVEHMTELLTYVYSTVFQKQIDQSINEESQQPRGIEELKYYPYYWQ